MRHQPLEEHESFVFLYKSSLLPRKAGRKGKRRGPREEKRREKGKHLPRDEGRRTGRKSPNRRQKTSSEKTPSEGTLGSYEERSSSPLGKGRGGGVRLLLYHGGKEETLVKPSGVKGREKAPLKGLSNNTERIQKLAVAKRERPPRKKGGQLGKHYL